MKQKKKFHIFIVIFAILLAGIQPILMLFDQVRHGGDMLPYTLFWFQALFGTDSSMMLRIVLPGVFLWFGQRKWYNKMHNESYVAGLDQKAYQSSIIKHTVQSWGKLSIILILFMIAVYFLPSLNNSEVAFDSVITSSYIKFILWYSLSTLLLGFSIVNVFFLLIRKDYSLLRIIALMILALFLLDPIMTDIIRNLFESWNDALIERLLNDATQLPSPYLIQSTLYYPITMILNAVFFIGSSLVLFTTISKGTEKNKS